MAGPSPHLVPPGFAWLEVRHHHHLTAWSPQGKLEVSSIAFADSKLTNRKSIGLDMPAGAGTTQWFDLPGTVEGSHEMLLVKAAAASALQLPARP